MNRPTVLAATLLVLGAASVGAYLSQRRPGPALACPPDQVRLGPDGVATCGPGTLPPAAARLALGAKLDLNRATAAELAAIDGVGPVLADALVAARASRGRFGDWAEVDQVTGVGPARLAALQAATELGQPDAQ